jgi:hypothetical protein
MTANVLDLLHDERALGLGRDVVEQLGDRREIPAGEDVMVDEAVTVVSIILSFFSGPPWR